MENLTLKDFIIPFKNFRGTKWIKMGISKYEVLCDESKIYADLHLNYLDGKLKSLKVECNGKYHDGVGDRVGAHALIGNYIVNQKYHFKFRGDDIHLEVCDMNPSGNLNTYYMLRSHIIPELLTATYTHLSSPTKYINLLPESMAHSIDYVHYPPDNSKNKEIFDKV